MLLLALPLAHYSPGRRCGMRQKGSVVLLDFLPHTGCQRPLDPRAC